MKFHIIKNTNISWFLEQTGSFGVLLGILAYPTTAYFKEWPKHLLSEWRKWLGILKVNHSLACFMRKFVSKKQHNIHADNVFYGVKMVEKLKQTKMESAICFSLLAENI